MKQSRFGLCISAVYNLLSLHLDACPRNETLQTKTHGNITSPRFPLNYPGNIDCFWRIRVQEKYRIKLKFTSPVYLDSNCTDYVEIQDGAKSVRLCASFTIPPPFYSSGNKLIVIFHSDGYGQTEARGIIGFTVTYSTVPAKTG